MGTQLVEQLALIAAPLLHPVRAAALARRIQPGWSSKAACLDSEHPDIWFPHEHALAAELAAPREACVRCPVARSCLAVGLLGQEHGIWGGTTEEQRRTALAALSAGATVDAVLDAARDVLDVEASPELDAA